MELSFKPAALAQQGSATLQPEKLPSLSLSSPLEGYRARQLAVFKDLLLTFTQGFKKRKMVSLLKNNCSWHVALVQLSQSSHQVKYFGSWNRDTGKPLQPVH